MNTPVGPTQPAVTPTQPPQVMPSPPAAASPKTKMKSKLPVSTLLGGAVLLIMLIAGGFWMYTINKPQVLVNRAAQACDAGCCNDGWCFGSDCNFTSGSCNDRNKIACTGHGGPKSGGGSISCGGTKTSPAPKASTSPTYNQAACTNACRAEKQQINGGVVDGRNTPSKNDGNVTGCECYCSSGTWDQNYTACVGGGPVVHKECNPGEKGTRQQDSCAYTCDSTGIWRKDNPSCGTGSPSPTASTGGGGGGGGGCAAGYTYCGGGPRGAGCYTINQCTCSQLIAKSTPPSGTTSGDVPSYLDNVMTQCGSSYQKPLATNTGGVNSNNGVTCDGTSCSAGGGQTCTNAQAYLYYCPGGLVNGKCMENRSSIGTSKNFDLAALAGGKTCGAIQVDYSLTDTVGASDCGAATYTMGPACTTQIVSSPTPPSSTPPSTPPSSPAAPVCLNVTMSKQVPLKGDSVTFTCGQVTGAFRYEFRVKLPDGTFKDVQPATTNGNVSQPFTIESIGAHAVQCRICTGTAASTCQAYETL